MSTDAIDSHIAITTDGYCTACGPGRKVLHGPDYIHPGFGEVELRLPTGFQWSTVTDYELTIADIERRIRGRRGLGWSMVIRGPLVTRTYQRRRGGHWVLVEEEKGFA